MNKKEINTIVDERENEGMRLVLLVTYGCCLKCEYCFVDKEAKNMDPEDMLKAVDLLLTSEKKDLQLHFFGGEPLMIPFQLIKDTVLYAERKMKEKGKVIRFFLTTNGVPIKDGMIEFFKQHNVFLELSLDGSAEAQNLNRPQEGKRDSYSLIVKNVPHIIESEVQSRVSMVVSPKTVDKLFENFQHIANLGFKNIFIMTACGVHWSKRDIMTLKKNLALIKKKYLNDFKSGKINFLNIEDWLSPFRMNTELAIDIDGTIFSACVGYLVHDEKLKDDFILGNVKTNKKKIDELNRMRMQNDFSARVIYKENNVIHDLPNNIEAGKVMDDFVNDLTRILKIKKGTVQKSPSVHRAFTKSVEQLVKSSGLENDKKMQKVQAVLAESPLEAFGKKFKFDFSFRADDLDDSLRFTFNDVGEINFADRILAIISIFNKDIHSEIARKLVAIVKSNKLTFGFEWKMNYKSPTIKIEFEELSETVLKKVFDCIGISNNAGLVKKVLKEKAVAMSVSFSGKNVGFKIHFMKKTLKDIGNFSLLNETFKKNILGYYKKAGKERDDYFYLVSPRYDVATGFKSIKCYRVYETGDNFAIKESEQRRIRDVKALDIALPQQKSKMLDSLGEISRNEGVFWHISIIGADFAKSIHSSVYFTIS